MSIIKIKLSQLIFDSFKEFSIKPITIEDITINKFGLDIPDWHSWACNIYTEDGQNLVIKSLKTPTDCLKRGIYFVKQNNGYKACINS